MGMRMNLLRYFIKNFWHTKGSVFGIMKSTLWRRQFKKMDYSYPVWGYDFSVVGTDEDTFPKEPEDGIALAEEFATKWK